MIKLIQDIRAMLDQLEKEFQQLERRIKKLERNAIDSGVIQ